MKLFYHVSNNGDGSASTHFHASEKEAEKAEEQEYEGFAESTISSVELSVVDGKIFFTNDDGDSVELKND